MKKLLTILIFLSACGGSDVTEAPIGTTTTSSSTTSTTTTTVQDTTTTSTTTTEYLTDLSSCVHQLPCCKYLFVDYFYTSNLNEMQHLFHSFERMEHCQ